MHKTIIDFLKGVQKAIDVEGLFFLGIEADRLAHFLLPFLIVLIFQKFKRKAQGILISVSIVSLKEVMDLSIVLYHEPVTYEIWIDSGRDISLGLLGIILAIQLPHILHLLAPLFRSQSKS